MSTLHPIRLEISHSDPIADAGLRAALSKVHDFEVIEVTSALDSQGVSRSECKSQPADIVLADFDNGLGIARARSGTGPHIEASPCKVLVVNGLDRERDIRAALHAGVRGYLVAGCGLEELKVAIRRVQHGERYLSPEAASRLADAVTREPLTPREEEVMAFVVHGYCNKTIARRLDIAVGTVKTHLNSVFGKLGVVRRTQAVLAVQQRGLALAPPDVDSARSPSTVGLPVARSLRALNRSIDQGVR